LCFLYRPTLDFGFPLLFTQVAEVNDRKSEGLVVRDDLNRLALDSAETGTQRFVPPDDFVEGALQGSSLQASFKAHGDRDVVGKAATLQLVYEPEALLGE
jgi:hypothetical protein